MDHKTSSHLYNCTSPRLSPHLRYRSSLVRTSTQRARLATHSNSAPSITKAVALLPTHTPPIADAARWCDNSTTATRVRSKAPRLTSFAVHNAERTAFPGGPCLALRHERQGLIKLLRQLHHHGAILVKPITQGMQFQHLLKLFEHHDRAHVLQSFQQGITLRCKPSHVSQCLEKPAVEREQMMLPEATLTQVSSAQRDVQSGYAVATAPPTTVAERHNFSEPIPASSMGRPFCSISRSR